MRCLCLKQTKISNSLVDDVWYVGSVPSTEKEKWSNIKRWKGKDVGAIENRWQIYFLMSIWLYTIAVAHSLTELDFTFELGHVVCVHKAAVHNPCLKRAVLSVTVITEAHTLVQPTFFKLKNSLCIACVLIPCWKIQVQISWPLHWSFYTGNGYLRYTTQAIITWCCAGMCCMDSDLTVLIIPIVRPQFNGLTVFTSIQLYTFII